MATWGRSLWIAALCGVLAAACAPDDEGGDVGWDGHGWDDGGWTDDGSGGTDDNGTGGDDGTPWEAPDVPDTTGEACAEQDFNIARVIPDMLIVLDRSNSMYDDGYWVPVRDAIINVTSEMDYEIWFGLMTFPNAQAPNVCAGTANQCQPAAGSLVGIGEGNAFAIRDALGALSTCGGTPIALTLQAAQTYMEMVTPVTGHPPFVLLATDGAPNCNDALPGGSCRCTNPLGGCVLNPSNCLDDARTYSVIEELRGSGVQLFVLGIGAGTTAWEDVLNEMAFRGGTAEAFWAEDPATIRTTFEDIAGAVATCEFDMQPIDPLADPNAVNFYFDGEVVPMDADGACDAGWQWVDAEHTRVTFCGVFCDRIMGREVTDIGATFGCPTILI